MAIKYYLLHSFGTKNSFQASVDLLNVSFPPGPPPFRDVSLYAWENQLQIDIAQLFS